MAKFPRRRGAFYYYNDRKYVSVTNVLKAIAKPALVNWAARTAAQAIFDDPYKVSTVNQAAQAIYKTKEKAGDRGSRVHEFAQAMTEGAEWPENPDGYEAAVISFLKTMTPEVLFTEVNVYSDTHGYAGTADLIAKIADKTWLIDYKTSRAVYPETGLQLAAYANAEFILADIPDSIMPIPRSDPDFEELVPEDVRDVQLDLPKIDATAAVLLRPDGQFEWVPTTAPFEVFLALAQVWRWQHE